MKEACKWCGERYKPSTSSGSIIWNIFNNFGKDADSVSQVSRASVPGYCSKKCQIEDLGREYSNEYEQKIKARKFRISIIELIVISAVVAATWMNSAGKANTAPTGNLVGNNKPNLDQQKNVIPASNIQTEPSLTQQEAEIRDWQQKLQQKKGRLQDADSATKAAFEEELKQYLVQLEKVKAKRAAQESGSRK